MLNKKSSGLTHGAYVTLLFRLTVGPMMLVYGLNKMFAWSLTITRIRGGFLETWLPEPLVTGYIAVLPVWEALVGALILLGLWYRLSLILTGLLMASLIFGLVVQGNPEVVGRNMIFVLALFFAYKHVDENPLSLDSLRAK